jgi:hypothetical protein
MLHEICEVEAKKSEIFLLLLHKFRVTYDNEVSK